MQQSCRLIAIDALKHAQLESDARGLDAIQDRYAASIHQESP
jgi:hypothetical protein